MYTPLYYANVTVHLLAALFWLGGMFFVAIVAAPVLRGTQSPEDRAVLFQRLGERFSTNRSSREQHAHTTTYIPAQPPDGVAFPETAEEVQDIVKVCAGHAVPVIAFGVGTSLEGHVNAPGGGIAVDTSGMKRVLAVNADDLDCTVEAGLTRGEGV